MGDHLGATREAAARHPEAGFGAVLLELRGEPVRLELSHELLRPFTGLEDPHLDGEVPRDLQRFPGLLRVTGGGGGVF